MTRLLLLLAVSVFIPTEVGAATWYVAKTGNDSSSCAQAQNPSTPKLTISAGLSCIGTGVGAGAGHTVEVAAGTYAESLNNTIPTGTSWNAPFTLQARSDDTVTIRPASGRVLRIDAGTAQYSIIKGFVLDGVNMTAGVAVVELAGTISFVRVQNNDIRNTNAVACSGVYFGDKTRNFELLSNRIHEVGCGHGLYVEGSNNLVRGNELYNMVRYGIHNYSSLPGVFPSNNVYDANWIHDTGSDDARASFAILITTGSNNLASNNLLTNNQEGIESGPVSGNKIYNNTVYGTGVGHGSACCYEAIHLDHSTNADIRNNIVYGNALNSIYIGASTGTVNSANLLTNPSFVNASGNDFHLQPGSVAVNAGAAIAMIATDRDGVSRPQGGAYDMGAFEYTTTSQSPPAAPTNVRIVR